MSDSPKMPRPLIPVVVKTRGCLKCDRSFESSGDRICPKCNELNLRESMLASRTFHGFRRRGYSVSHGGNS